jgi:N2-acetyl-L-2,4-diaminobutanoate deacetylase
VADLAPSPIRATVDFDAMGVQHGHLVLPHSRDESAWGSVMIPVAVIRGGEGPTALLTGGNHGDEYAGPIALFDLALTLRPEEVTGRVIILPALNQPAFAAARRTSPIDGGNLNRSFPGRPDGSVTQKIADYVQRVLLPMSDVVLDFHSGGKTLDFLPFCAAHVLDDSPDAKAQEARALALVAAFGAPYSVRMREIDAVGMFDTAAEAMGKVFVTTELGGGGTASARTVEIARRGSRELLIAAGVVTGQPEPRLTRWLDMPDARCFHVAEEGGLIRFLVDLGDRVAEGQVLALIYPLGRTGQTPKEVASARAGLVISRHHPGLLQPGDCVAVVAEETGSDAALSVTDV